MSNALHRLITHPSVVAVLVVMTVAGIGTYLLNSSHALSPQSQTQTQTKAVLLQPYSLGTAPYQYIAYAGSLDKTRVLTGVKQYFAAFVISAATACTPSWGGGVTNGMESPRGNAIATDFMALRTAGGEVAVSFGGSHGSELAATCQSTDQLTAAYKSVIDTYNLSRLDFDIEGASLTDTTANARRAEAVARLQRANPKLKIWLTLPVTPTGLTVQGQDVVRQFSDKGIIVSGVNIMAMNYNVATKDMGLQAVNAAKSSHRQLRELYPGVSDLDAWKGLGVIVMVGRNDTVPETFTMQDAQTVRAFAVDNHIGLLSLWNTDRDKSCPEPSSGTSTPSTVSPSALCSGVAQQPYDFLKILTVSAQR